ncbi:UPF0280 family protein [Aminobacter sp. BA135]|uniref:UPF0280 family protein n=1 Tax=Aminobacter sp. BA135 TaxID=537596 RepID=UPI003D7A903D
MNGPEISWLPDKHRLHFNHGPIDLIVEAFGETGEVRAAYEQAAERFQTILDELVKELAQLRRPASSRPRDFDGPTARRMEAAVAPLAGQFITPMAAVAGSVADEMMAAMIAGRSIERAYVNNGGDIALHIALGQEFSVAIAGTGHGLADRLTIHWPDAVRGIATSGWRGRSFSLGIADAVTVLAANAAAADAAATLIANAVDLPGHTAIHRRPACDLAPDSDLGDRLVTTDVAPLAPADIEAALDAGFSVAESLRRQGSIQTAALYLGGRTRISGTHELAVTDGVTRGEPVHA